MILAIDHDVRVSEKKEGAKGVGRILATVFVSSCLLLLQSCYVAQAVPLFKIVLLCCCYGPSLYIFKKFMLCWTCWRTVPVRESVLNQFLSLGLSA